MVDVVKKYGKDWISNPQFWLDDAETIKKRLGEMKPLGCATVKPDNDVASNFITAQAFIEELDEYITSLIMAHHDNLELIISLRSDYYDHSIEIDISSKDNEGELETIAFPWEPCKEVKDAIRDLGFHIVYWNFSLGDGKITEIRGNEPRRTKGGKHKHVEGVGYVDLDWEPKCSME